MSPTNDTVASLLLFPSPSSAYFRHRHRHLLLLTDGGDDDDGLLFGNVSLLTTSSYSPSSSSSSHSPTASGNSTAADDEERLRLELLIYYKTLIPTWIVCCLATLILNTVVVLSSRWVPRPMTPTVTLSLSLAAADAYTSLILCSSLIYDSLLLKVFDIDFGHYQTCFSLLIEVCRFGGLVVTALHLLALSVNHLFGASYPLKYPRNVRQNFLAGVIAALWVLPNAFFAVYFSSVPGQGFQSERCMSLSFFGQVRFRLVVACLIFTPLVAMIVIYAQIYSTIRKSRRLQLTVHRCETTQQARRRNSKALVTTLLILGTYTVGWIPAVTQLVIICDGCFVQMQAITRETLIIMTSFTNSLLILKAFVDPIVYAVRIPEVRGAVQTMWHKWFVRDLNEWSRTRGDFRMRSISASRARAMGLNTTRFRSWHGHSQLSRLNTNGNFNINNNNDTQHMSNIASAGNLIQLNANGVSGRPHRVNTLQPKRSRSILRRHNSSRLQTGIIIPFLTANDKRDACLNAGFLKNGGVGVGGGGGFFGNNIKRGFFSVPGWTKKTKSNKHQQRRDEDDEENEVDTTPELTETMSLRHRPPTSVVATAAATTATVGSQAGRDGVGSSPGGMFRVGSGDSLPCSGLLTTTTSSSRKTGPGGSQETFV